MKLLRAAATLLGSLAVMGWLAHKAAPPLSDRWAGAATNTAHFRISSATSDAGLAGRVATLLEAEYRRVSSALGHELRQPVQVRVTSSRLLYNWSCAIPVPTPPGDGFAGSAGDRGVNLLLPANWQPGDESEIPDRGRTLAVHEVVHLILYDMNPSILHKRWLNEGIAWSLALNLDSPAMRRLDAGWMGADLERGTAPRMSDIAADDQKNWVRRKGDLYSREFVRFVAERYGADKLSAMTRSADDLRQALGKDELDLHPEWLAWLRSRYASGA